MPKPLASNADFSPGTVWLVGAGPGDPELLTRKAERLIGAASVVFHDALVGEGIIQPRPARAARPRWQALRPPLQAAGVPISICPGITAASAAAAGIGASLTLRELARKLTFVTAHARAGEALDLDWARLADPDATLAVYMGKAAAGEVSANLIAAGLPGDTPVALVENASLPNQRIMSTRLDLLGLAAKTALGDGPALLLIGQAVVAGPALASSAHRGDEALHSSHRKLPTVRRQPIVYQ